MVSIFKNTLPIRSSKTDDADDEYNIEYSFASEYTGPPVSFHIPKALPVDVSRIPTASVVSTPSSSRNLSFPVIYPVGKRETSLFSCNETSPGLGEIGAENLGKEAGFVSLDFSDSLENSNWFSASSNADELDNNFHEPGSRSRFLEKEASFVSLEFSDSLEINSNGFSASSDADELDNDFHEIEQVLSSAREPGSRSRATVHEESDYSEPGIMVQEKSRSRAMANVKKGICHHCLKGNRFTSKEACIVCDARYCGKCVLRVMGAMPEGRKCVSCIGYPVNESKRVNLGKCSKILKNLLTDYEVKQVMRFEKTCQVNQAPFWLVIVNGNPLSEEEVVRLQTCEYPPKRLAPGSYWYDKLSGFWGEEGHKPCQIISPRLAVGGAIKENASNGNTKVKINNRVITKAELLMLKFARINYKGCPHFWVSHNGTYQEEGQKQKQGKIWEKPGIKAFCALLSLPVPPASLISSEEEVEHNGSQLGQKITAIKPLTKILLVGKDQSGTSAIYKQAKIHYKVPFSEDERETIKFSIQRNLYLYISILLNGLNEFEEDYSVQIRRNVIDQPSTSAAGGSWVENVETNKYSLSKKLRKFSDWLLEIVRSGNLDVVFPAATREYSVLVQELWKDKAFQATYARRNELCALPTVADYFLPRAAEISRIDYEPSDMDILYADGITSSNGLTSMEFSVPSSSSNNFMESTEQNNSQMERYQLIRVSSSNLGDNCKWLSMFEDVDLVLYCVDLTSYNEFYTDNNLVLKNKMLESKNIFENIVTHPRFKTKAFLLILNKFDLLENKIKTTPLTQCEWFHDFNPFITNYTYNDKSSRSNNNNNNNNSSVAQYGFQYIAAKFKKLFNELTGRKLYVSPVTGLDGDSVDTAIRYGKEVLMWVDEENKPASSNNEWTTETTETTI